MNPIGSWVRTHFHQVCCTLLLLGSVRNTQADENLEETKKKILHRLQFALKDKPPIRLIGVAVYKKSVPVLGMTPLPSTKIQVDVLSPSCIVSLQLSQPQELYVSANSEKMYAFNQSDKKVGAEPIWIPGTLSPQDLYSLTHVGAPLMPIHDFGQVHFQRTSHPSQFTLRLQTTTETGSFKSQNEMLTVDSARNKITYARMDSVDRYERSFLQFQMYNIWSVSKDEKGSSFIVKSKMDANFIAGGQPQYRAVEIDWEQPTLLSSSEIQQRRAMCALVSKEIKQRESRTKGSAPIARALPKSPYINLMIFKKSVHL